MHSFLNPHNPLERIEECAYFKMWALQADHILCLISSSIKSKDLNYVNDSHGLHWFHLKHSLESRSSP